MKRLQLLDDFISLFFPNCCVGCNDSLVTGEDILCTRCILDLPQTDYHLRSSPIKEKMALRLPVKHGLAFLRFRKEGIVQQLLHELKYNRKPEIGVKLGKIYGRTLAQSTLSKEFDLIIPVPLHESRLRARGYNQSAKFAEGLSQALEVPWDESVSVRKGKTATQTRKSKQERWENVKEVFTISASSKIEGKRVLLVDDVITTGATLEACGGHLLAHGCVELSVACIAEA